MNELDRQQRSDVATMAERLRVGLIDRRHFIRAAGMAWSEQQPESDHRRGQDATEGAPWVAGGRCIDRT